jgi:isopentenyldiphosphate isomerase
MEKASLEKKSQELLDVVDEEGRVIGQATREMCHSNPELLHPTVHFTLVDLKNRAVLLSVRNRDQEYDGGMVTFFGEHVLSGERMNRALVRGVEEELGFVPKSFLPLEGHIFRYGNQRELATFYLVTYNGEELNFDTEEIESLKWVRFMSPLEEPVNIFEDRSFYDAVCLILARMHYALGEEVKESGDNVGEITRYWIDSFDREKTSS